MEGGLDSPDSEDIQAATESLGTVVREWAEPAVKPPEEVNEDEEIDSMQISNQTHYVEAEIDSDVIEESIDSEQDLEQNIEPSSTKPSEELSESTPAAIVKEIVYINQPRKAQRIRRQRKAVATRTIPRNQQGIQAAAANAHDARELLDIENRFTTPQSTFSNSLDTYAARQNKAIESMRLKSSAKSDSSLNYATHQLDDLQELNLPDTSLPKRPLEALKGRQPINTHTSLTPLMARPGVSNSPQPKEAIRESASRQQTESSLEMKLSVWEIEDRERLKKKSEGAKK